MSTWQIRLLEWLRVISLKIPISRPQSDGIRRSVITSRLKDISPASGYLKLSR